LIGTALARGEWRGALAVAIAAVALWRKLTLEEVVMVRQFGDAYVRYTQRARALIPFVL
jgi:protein-S-isoprenylcysteine O-methyltransferase Ste14